MPAVDDFSGTSETSFTSPCGMAEWSLAGNAPSFLKLSTSSSKDGWWDARVLLAVSRSDLLSVR